MPLTSPPHSAGMTTDRTDVVIIGAGPIGLELAVAFQREGIDYLQIEASAIGSTIAWYPLQMPFHSNAERLSIAGVPIQTADQNKPTREEYLAYLRSVVLQFGLQIRSHERVEGIERAGERFRLRTSRGVVEANRIVLAIGAMHRPRLLHIPGEELPHVSHYFHEPHPFFGRRLLIVGGKNSAVETAIRCQRAGALVTLSYRGTDFDPAHVKFWLLPELRSMVRDDRAHILPGTTPLEIRPHSVLLSTADGLQEIDADAVLLMTGYEQDPSLLKMAGVTLQGDAQAPVYDEATMETDVPGVFVAGTAIAGSPVGKVRVIVETCHVHVPRIVAALQGRRAVVAGGATDD